MTARAVVIRETNVFLTNPDMLHLSILPKHTQWKRVLANLQCVNTTVYLEMLAWLVWS